MRYALLLVAGLLLAANLGCSGVNLARRGCHSCGGGHGGQMAHGGGCPDGACGYAPGGHGHGGGYGHGGGLGGGDGLGGHAGVLHPNTRGTPGINGHHQHREFHGPAGPASATVAYPYYTIRGPRDFLVDNPPSIGR